VVPVSPHEIAFVVEGEPGQLSLEAVSEALEAFKTFLQGTGNASWVLGSLAVGSARLGAAIADLSQEEADSRFQEIIEGIESIESGAEAPASWSTHALGGLVKMAGIGNRRDAIGAHVATARKEIQMTRHLAEQARRARRARTQPRLSFGSVTGEVDRFIARNKREFGLIDEATKRPVTVQFSENDLEIVTTEMISRRVTVWGPLQHNADGGKDVLTMEGFEVRDVTRDGGRLTVDEVAGSLGPDWTAGMNSIDWVREMRRG